MRKIKAVHFGIVVSLALAGCNQAPDPRLTALADEAAIDDLITDYYNHFGGGIGERVGEYYAADGEMILGTTSYKGLEAIEGAYAAVPADAPQRSAFALNILIGNPLIKVDGDHATARLVFTETIVDKEGDAPRILVQGREFDWLEKQPDGRWLIKKRQIMGPSGVPEGWED